MPTKAKPTPAPSIQNGSTTPALDQLPPRQNAFVKAYTDPASPAYSNGVQSANEAGYKGKYRSNAITAHQLLNQPKIRSAIAERLEQAGIGAEVRSSIITEIAKQRTATIEHYDGDGVLTQRQVVDNSGNRLKAVAMASKLAGDYDSAREAAHLQAKALSPLIETWTKRLRAELSISPQREPTLDSADSVIVDSEPSEPDALQGLGEGMAGSVGQGGDPSVGKGAQEDGVGGGRGGCA